MKIELLKPHTHAGKPYQAGDKIEVNADIAQWLADNRVAKPVKKPAAPINPKEQ